MTVALEIFCDFDGTVTTRDTVDFILEELADLSWTDIEKRWEKGEIGSRECMAQQVALIRGGWSAVESVLDKVEIDPGFANFVSWCRASAIPFTIVSDGLDCTIDYILTREGIAVDSVLANHLVEASDGSLSLTFPYSKEGCGSGVCKCKVLDLKNRTRVFIGDGRSDFCAAGEADLVFAKDKLVQYMSDKGLPFTSFGNFDDVRAELEKRISGKSNIFGKYAAVDALSFKPIARENFRCLI